MDIFLNPDGTALHLELGSLEEARGFWTEANTTAGFYVVLARQLPFRARLRVETRATGFELDCEAEAVQVFPVAGGFGTAFQLSEWDAEKAAELERRLAGEEAAAESELSPMFRIKKMNPSERFRLAMKATRVERQILLRDGSPQVLLGLLQHPQIETQEVLEIAKSAFATAAIMEQVAGNRKWMAHPELPSIIAKSPKTPQPLALKLLDHLRTPDLQQLAKSQAVREAIRKAALKAYLKRIGKG